MELSSLEHEVLAAAKDAPADCGDHSSMKALSETLPAHTQLEISDTLRALSGKQLVTFDEHGCVVVSESGVAALKLI